MPSRRLAAFPRFFLVACCYSLCGGCAAPHAADPGNAPTPTELATQMRNAYQQLEYIEFEARVTHKDWRIRCTIVSDANGRNHLEVFHEGKLIYILDQRPQLGGMMRVVEENRVTNKRAEDYLTPDEFAAKAGTLKLDVFELFGFDGCLFGGYLQTWLGKDGHEPEFWERIISEGSYVGRFKLGTKECHVIATGRPHRRDEELWLDVKTGLVQRWRDCVRDRGYEYGKTVKPLPRR